jgi:hypothetical protein
MLTLVFAILGLVSSGFGLYFTSGANWHDSSICWNLATIFWVCAYMA